MIHLHDIDHSIYEDKSKYSYATLRYEDGFFNILWTVYPCGERFVVDNIEIVYDDGEPINIIHNTNTIAFENPKYNWRTVLEEPSMLSATEIAHKFTPTVEEFEEMFSDELQDASDIRECA
jgi:hypothetical protein